jgi:hypothetical protein
MKVCMFCAGLPRFGEYFYENLFNIINDTTIDLYFYMWDSFLDYRKIFNKIPDNYKIKKFIQAEEPSKEYLSIHGKMKTSENSDVERIVTSCFKQHFGLYKSFSIIEEEYDCYIRFRVDGKINEKINLKNYNFDEHIYIPKNMQCSLTNNIKPFNDQFAIGNYQNMKKYCSLFDSIDDLFFNGKVPIHQENALRYFLEQEGVSIMTADFEHYLEKR